MHLLQPDEAAIKSLQIARFRQTCAQFGATFRHSHAHAHTQSHSHGAMEPWSHETPESSAKKNLLGQLRAPVGVGVALAALKCRPAVCHNFPLFFSTFSCTFTFPIVAALGNLQFAILIYEFAQGVKVAQAMGRVLYGAALAHQCDDRPQIGPTIWTASTQ